MYNKELREWFSFVSKPSAQFLFNLGIKPNQVSFLVLILGCLGGWFIYKADWLYALIAILLSGFFDILDGAIAKNHDCKSKFGTILDTSFDKISEFSWYLGIAMFNPALTLLAFYASNITLISTIVLNDAKRFNYEKISDLEGFVERKDRLVLVGLGVIFPQYFHVVLWIICLAATLVTLQRLYLSYKYFKNA